MKDVIKNNSRNYLEALSEYKVKCKRCGHSVFMIRRKKLMCNWCGAMIYRSEKDEFKDKLEREIRKR